MDTLDLTTLTNIPEFKDSDCILKIILKINI